MFALFVFFHLCLYIIFILLVKLTNTEMFLIFLDHQVHFCLVFSEDVDVLVELRFTHV
jgi:hypothetical protein